MKTEIAGELGIANYDSVDKGNLTARQNGYIGSYMTRRLVEMTTVVREIKVALIILDILIL